MSSHQLPPLPERLSALGEGTSVHGATGEVTQWVGCTISGKLRSGVERVYELVGYGYSCVPKTSQAAWQHLYALEAAERQEQAIQRAGPDTGDILTEEVYTSQGAAEEDDELQTVAVEQQWSPSDRLLAGLPDVLHLPFQLQGRLHISSRHIVLCKKHTFIGSSSELLYKGFVNLSEDALTLTLQMRCSDTGAEAFLSFLVQAWE